MADNPSMSFPDWLLAEVDERRGNTPRSQYMQEAAFGRLLDEDAGEWDIEKEDIDPKRVDLQHAAEAVAGGAD